MYRTLIMKETRELAIWAAAGVGLLALFLVSNAGLNPLTLSAATYNMPIPFINSGVRDSLAGIGGLIAVVLALRQTIGESIQGTWLLLLHRPFPRQRLIAIKLFTGAAILLIATLLPLLGFTIWAAVPGTHASPFRWIFTAPIWPLWFGLTTIYLGGFLTGMREVPWVGTRLLPLAGSLAAFGMICVLLELNFLVWAIVAVVLADAVLLAAIFEVSSTRNFAG